MSAMSALVLPNTPARPECAAYSRRDAWIADGYKSMWLRSDGKVYPSRKPVTPGDNFRSEGGPSPYSRTAKRIDLASKKECVGPIANAIRAGQTEFEPRRRFDAGQPRDEDAPPEDHVFDPRLACPECSDPTSWCDCADHRRAA